MDYSMAQWEQWKQVRSSFLWMEMGQGLLPGYTQLRACPCHCAWSHSLRYALCSIQDNGLTNGWADAYHPSPQFTPNGLTLAGCASLRVPVPDESLPAAVLRRGAAAGGDRPGQRTPRGYPPGSKGCAPRGRRRQAPPQPPHSSRRAGGWRGGFGDTLRVDEQCQVHATREISVQICGEEWAGGANPWQVGAQSAAGIACAGYRPRRVSRLQPGGLRMKTQSDPSINLIIMPPRDARV